MFRAGRQKKKKHDIKTPKHTLSQRPYEENQAYQRQLFQKNIPRESKKNIYGGHNCLSKRTSHGIYIGR